MNSDLRIDLISVIEQRAPVRLKRVATTGGGEYAGNCPFCGKGIDRLRVWPHAEFAHYWCRVCDRRGDAITFLREYEGMSFVDACAALGILPDDAGSYRGTPPPSGLGSSPCSQWKDVADSFIHFAMKTLHSEKGKAYREYLLRRGITAATILAKQIGYVPLGKDDRWMETPFEKWGLTEEMIAPEQWAKGCVRIPDGLLFPHYGPDGRPWKLTMSRPLATILPEHARGQIIGSKECLLNEHLITQDKPVMLTESFLDAISIEQEAGDLVTAVSTNGTGGCRSQRIQAVIQKAPYVLQSFDADPAGREGADWWCCAIAHCVRWAPTYPSKDANEMLTNGQDIRAWVQAGISHATDNALRTSTDVVVPAHTSIGVDGEPDPLCFACAAIVEHYTDQGTPCCTKHYAGQQTIEQALAAYTQEVREQIPSTDPLTQFAQIVDKIADVFAPCTVTRDPPGYTLQEHAAFLTSKEKQARIAKEVAIRQASRDRQYEKTRIQDAAHDVAFTE